MTPSLVSFYTEEARQLVHSTAFILNSASFNLGECNFNRSAQVLLRSPRLVFHQNSGRVVQMVCNYYSLT